MDDEQLKEFFWHSKGRFDGSCDVCRMYLMMYGIECVCVCVRLFSGVFFFAWCRSDVPLRLRPFMYDLQGFCGFGLHFGHLAGLG